MNRMFRWSIYLLIAFILSIIYYFYSFWNLFDDNNPTEISDTINNKSRDIIVSLSHFINN